MRRCGGKAERMLERLSKLMKGFLSLFVSGLEAANPRALLEAEIASLHEAIANYNRNLAKQAAMVERMKGQIERERREVDKLKGRITALYNAKQMEEAGRLALQAKSLAQHLADAEAAYQQAEKMYRDLTAQRDVYVRDARRRIDAIKQKMTQAEVAESQAQLAEIASSTAFDMAGSGATLERLEQNLDERVAQAKGKARVASESAGTGEWTMKAGEEAALESQALAEFATLMGLPAQANAAAPAPKAAEPPPRELGPG